MKSKLISQIIKFCGVGVVMVIWSTIAFYIAFEILDLPLFGTYILLYIIAIFISYYLNSKYTFQEKRTKSDLIKYYIVYVVGMSFGLLILWLLAQHTSFTKFQMTLIQIVPRTALTFVFTKLFIYNK